MQILHVEVGGGYGGSVRALEVYLAHSDSSRFVHDVLFLYPTLGTEGIKPWARRVWTLYDEPPKGILAGVPGARQLLDQRPERWDRALSGAYEWVGLTRSLPQVMRLRRVLRSGGYDLVHVNNTFSYQPSTLIAARSTRVPVVAHVRNPVRASALNRRLMRMVNSLVTVSRSLEKQLRGWGLPAPIRTCYDGVDIGAPDEHAASALRASLIPPGGILIGSVGRLDTQKGYHDLIRAARIVVDAHPEVRFAIAGSGPLQACLEKLIAELKLTDRFHLLGFRSDVPSFLAALDLFVSPSLWEGLPLALVEAMLLGKPVVVTDVGGNSEIVLAGGAGDLVPPKKPGAMATALLAALEQKDVLARRAQESRRGAAALSDSRRCAQDFDEVLDGVMRTSDSRTREFYERAYTTEAWRRPEGVDPRPPGWRFRKMWYRALLDHVVPQLKLQAKRVLEVGCGNGYLAPYLCQSEAVFVGVDIALNAVRQFPRANGAKCYAAVADGKLLPFPDNSFDVLICLEVLEHVRDPNPVLDECFRVIRPSGYLAFSCPNYCNLFFFPKLLSDLGVPYFRRYMRRQVIDRTTTALALRQSLARRGTLLLQRGVRLHPPLFEQLDYRLPASSPLRRINDWVFAIEKRWGAGSLLRYLGLHTLCLVRAERKRGS